MKLGRTSTNLMLFTAYRIVYVLKRSDHASSYGEPDYVMEGVKILEYYEESVVLAEGHMNWRYTRQ